MVVHGLLAMERVSRLGGWGTVRRSAVLSLLYQGMLGIGTMVITVLALSAGH